MVNALKRLRNSKGWTHEQAANAMGISRGQFIKLERGERRLTERTIMLAARAFGTPRAEILGDDEVEAGPPPILGQIPVFVAAEGGAGQMVVSTVPIREVDRPWYLGDTSNGYAVLIVGESMVPAFEPGDIAVVDPRLPPMKGKDMIFISGEKTGEFVASIKRLIRWTPQDWIVHQFNPPKGQKNDFSLQRKTWPKALRVVGKLYG